MTTILTTARLELRKFELTDASFILELLNTPAWLQFIGDRNVKNEQDAVAYLENRLIKGYENGFGFYVMMLQDSKVPIGIVGFVKRAELPHVDIGYALLPAYEGKGYAYEAAQATLEYGKKALGFTTVLAIITPNNVRSIKLIEQLGLQYQQTIVLNQEDLLLYTT
jgi:ribosomal-protein-alanine N-acetyltransferase